MAEWTYSNWRSAGATGTSLRLAALENHIAEVSNRLASNKRLTSVSFTAEKPSSELVEYLKLLEGLREREADAVELAAGQRVGFSQGFAIGEAGVSRGPYE